MASSIEIGPADGAFTRGANLRSTIVVRFDKPTKVRGIRAWFRGVEETKANYTTTTTGSDGKVQTTTHTAVQQSDLVACDYPLAGSGPLGFFGSISDGVATLFGGGQHETYPEGEHRFEVEFQVPADAPPTHTGKKSRVFYELTAQVDIPLGRNLTARTEFLLPPLPRAAEAAQPVRVRHPDGQPRGLIDSMFGKELQLEAALKADRYCLGETIEGLLCVEAQKPVACRCVKASLVAVETSTANGYNESYSYREPAIEIAQPGMLEGSWTERFSLPAAISGPPSARGARFSVQWHVQLELDLPWATDPTIRLPIELHVA